MENFIPTRGSRLKNVGEQNFTTVKYEAPKRKIASVSNFESTEGKSSRTQTGSNDISDIKKKQELEMKRARYDVIKFGMSGFEKAKAEEAKVALAISLGAKPPKNKVVNYKILLQKKREEKEILERTEHKSGLAKSMVKHKSQKTKRKPKDSILGIYGKVDRTRVSKGKK